MKRTLTVLLATINFMIVATVFSQEHPLHQVEVTFSNPSKLGILKASLVYGGITVEGYNGDEVIIEAKTRISVREKSLGHFGLHPIMRSSPGLKVEEEGNVMKVTAGSHHRTMDLIIRTPIHTSLKLGTMNHGDIFVENVKGQLDIKSMNAEIRILNVAGTVTASTMNGDIVVRFNEIDSENSMAFTTMNGDVDITLPKKVNANVKMKTEHGDILSDFDIEIKSNRQIKKETRSRSGYRIKFGSSLQGKINHGGPEYDFTTTNGNIYIRKAK